MQPVIDEFFKPFDYIHSNQVCFSTLYNNEYLSDMTIEIGNETIKAHSVIFRSVPALQKYIAKGKKVIIEQKDASIIKSLILHAYDRFELKNLLQLEKRTFLYRSFSNIFNNSEDSDFLMESSLGEKLYVHRAILEVSNLEFFKKIVRVQLKENIHSHLIIYENFEVVKLVLEYIYSGKLPEYADIESKVAFEIALAYYKAQKTYLMDEQDMTIYFGNENIKVHSVIFKSIQALQKYTVQGNNIVIDPSEAGSLKSLIEKAYDSFGVKIL
jgi:hypothetical protein